ncbi:arylformamidase [Spinactinospora alkalitolerans]|uniref:Arylformamidase n=1 Tax=Spinactinospora alkalitolerans TaxID=687207 RepID=A0A852TVF4_9ACTN|nr:alpha/beta hydrolase [Spinactinospora alkalitolerans]NYE48466.1 arylformamidase [Spinactinospora alkalitolerans]
MAAYREHSGAARRRMVWRRFRYASSPRSTVDFFPAGAGSPLLVYVHGGYWQELSAPDSCFPAPGLVGQGVSFAALGYELAPGRTLSGIVDMVGEGLRWLWSNAGALEVDPQRIIAAGSSAGAHLVAMNLLRGRADAIIATAVLLSGVYDLEPVRLSYVNEALGLTRAAAVRNSPLLRLADPLPPLVLAIGENETSEFTRQHREFSRATRPLCTRHMEFTVPGRNHFDLVFDLSDPDSALGGAVAAAAANRRRTPAP